VIELADFFLRSGIQHGRHDDRRAAQVGHLVVGDGIEHRLGADPSQADVGAADTGQVQGKHQPLQWNMGSVQR
jgi:hypothetical protein